MKGTLLLFIVIILLTSCNDKYVVPDDMMEGVLSEDVSNPQYNPKGHIPIEVLNYPSLTNEERDFLIDLSKKKSIAFCLNDGEFDVFLSQIRKNPKLKDLLLGDISSKVEKVQRTKSMHEDSWVVYGNKLKTGNTKSTYTQTRLKYIETLTIAGIEAGKVFGRTEVVVSDRGIVSSKVKLIFRKREGLLSGVHDFKDDDNSFGNVQSDRFLLRCTGIGVFYLNLKIGGVLDKPVVTNVYNTWSERYNPPTIGGSNGGYEPINPGNGGIDGGTSEMGKAYMESKNCTGEYVMALDMRTAFGFLNARSFSPIGSGFACYPNNDIFP
jgi:hypothetical protein